MAKQQDTNTSKSRVIGICVAVVMAALVGVIVYLLVTRTTGIKEEPRNVVVTQNNVEKVLDNLEKMEEIEVYNFPKIFIAGQIYGKFQDRDIEGVIESYEEIEVQTSASSNKLL